MLDPDQHAAGVYRAIALRFYCRYVEMRPARWPAFSFKGARCGPADSLDARSAISATELAPRSGGIISKSRRYRRMPSKQRAQQGKHNLRQRAAILCNCYSEQPNTM